MKCSIFLCLLIFSLQLYAQNKFVGHYYDYFGSRIDIRADSTFKFTWQVDLSGSWSKGIWQVNKDTIYFKVIALYDTLEHKDWKTNNTIDSLILSLDETPNRIPISVISPGLISGGQNYFPCPEKLVYKRGRLFGIYKGKLDRQRRNGLMIRMTAPPWFVKETVRPN